MSDDLSSVEPRTRSWFDKIAQVFSDEPTDTSSLLELLRNAREDQVLDADALAMIEGALQVSSRQVRDIMIPRSRVVTVPATLPPREIIELVTKASHSRFPVISDSVDNVMGILLARDLLPLILDDDTKELDVSNVVRPATFVPENKRLNALLKQFRETRRHLAIVIDEYGSFSGIVTMEDVLEQIVGDIEDEYDVELDQDSYIRKFDDRNYVVKALTPVEEFKDYFNVDFNDQESATVGGLMLRQFGHIPKRGDRTTVGPLLVTILNADNRQIKLIKVSPEQADSRESVPSGA